MARWSLAVALILGACSESTPAPRDAFGDFEDTVGDFAWTYLPKADGGVCPYEAYGSKIVCFGQDPSPYWQYLRPTDAGTPGVCPGENAFDGAFLGDCTAVGCGPLTSSSVSALVDAGSDVGCCFVVEVYCGA